MKLWCKVVFVVASFAVLAAAQSQLGVAPNKKAGEAFKNVTTSTLKELSVDDFLASMGVISAALGFDCADCHPHAGTDQADFVTDATPAKRTARRMIETVEILRGSTARHVLYVPSHARSSGDNDRSG